MFISTENENNKGYTPSVNVGPRQCKGDYIVTLNSDVIVTKGWLKVLVRCLFTELVSKVGKILQAAVALDKPTMEYEFKQYVAIHSWRSRSGRVFDSIVHE